MLRRLLFAVLMACAFAAQAVTVYSSPFGPKPQFVDANGAPMSSGTISTFIAGTTTAQVTYTDATGGSSNPTTITLNTRGETPNEFWFASGVSYKLVLKDSSGVTVWTIDSLSGINDVAAQTGNEWIASGLTPTFVSATSFTVTGDQTTTLQVGRRLKTTNTSGTVYSTITASAFSAVTTVTVANDTSTLDSGLSAVSYSLVSATNPAISADMVARKGTAVTSATTTNIWGIVGDYVHVTGTTTITSLGTAPYAGAQRTVIFDGILTLTHNGTTLLLPGAANIQTAANDRVIVRADTTANMIVVKYERASGLPVVGTSVPRSYLAGCTMSTAGASTTMTIAACQSTDSTNVVTMSTSSSIAKTTGAWAVGSATGCLDTGAIANATWYHFYEIMRADTGIVDILCSTSASAPTMPSNYSYKRRIGSGLTNGSAQWVAFSQQGDEFIWLASVLDVSANNPGTGAVTRTMASIPTGIKVWHIGNWNSRNAGAAVNQVMLISAMDQNDEAPVANAAPLFSVGEPYSGFGANDAAVGRFVVRTNTSAQIRSRLFASDANVTLYATTIGWIDRRGRDD